LGFRDDHDAALARADALQRELDEAAGERDLNKEQLEAAQEEIAELRAQIPPEEPAPLESGTRRSRRRPKKASTGVTEAPEPAEDTEPPEPGKATELNRGERVQQGRAWILLGGAAMFGVLMGALSHC